MGFSRFDLGGELRVAHLEALRHLLSLLKEVVGMVEISDEKLQAVILNDDLHSFKGQMPMCNIIGMHLFNSFRYILD